MSTPNIPGLELDALSLTLNTQRKYLTTLKKNIEAFSNDDFFSAEKGEFSASRYRKTVRVDLGEGIRTMWVQVNPFNGDDSPLRIEFKGHPYEEVHYERAVQIIKVLLLNIPTEKVYTCVTRIDVAMNVEGSLDYLYCHKLRSKVYSATFAQKGELVCIRLGKSTSKFYLCIYAKQWKESRYSYVTSPGCLRVEMRFKPRAPLESIFTELDIQKRLDSILFINRRRLFNKNILTASQRSIVRRFGITPLIMSYSPNEKRQLINKLKEFNEPLLSPDFVLKRCKEIQDQLCGLLGNRATD